MRQLRLRLLATCPLRPCLLAARGYDTFYHWASPLPSPEVLYVIRAAPRP
jgi:hypothetical protein